MARDDIRFLNMVTLRSLANDQIWTLRSLRANRQSPPPRRR